MKTSYLTQFKHLRYTFVPAFLVTQESADLLLPQKNLPLFSLLDIL